jgi:hypothetical protein
MTSANYERISSCVPEEQRQNNVIYIEDHLRRRNRRAENLQEIYKGLIILAIITVTFITCALFHL